MRVGVGWMVMKVGWRRGDVGAVRWVVGEEEVSGGFGVGEERKGEEVKAGLWGCWFYVFEFGGL